MANYVALLRGIGPGDPNMRNEKLRKVFEKLGFTNVQTVIASGNVLFTTRAQNVAKLETKIEKALTKQLGFSRAVIIRSQTQLQKLVDRNPFKGIEDTRHSQQNVTFLKRKTTTKLRLPYQVPDKTYQILGLHDGAVWSVIDVTGSKTPDLMTWLEKQFSKDITTRTWKTVNRILTKFGTMNT